MNSLQSIRVAHRARANGNLRAHCESPPSGIGNCAPPREARCLPFGNYTGKKEEAMNSQQGNRGSNQSGMQDDKARQAGQSGSGNDVNQRGGQHAGSESDNRSGTGKQGGNPQQSGSK